MSHAQSQEHPVPTLALDPLAPLSSIRLGLVWGFDLPGCKPTAAPPGFVAELLERVRAVGESFLDPARKAAVRDMLRFGAYKPAGRSKPSSEYLLAAALEGAFPLVNGPVDINNAVSLESGYPASIFDARKSGYALLVRRGREGESYIFNRSGQTIDLHDLLCVCHRFEDAWRPCGNPVKDAMETKVLEATSDIVAVIYAPAQDPQERLEQSAARFAELLRTHGKAAQCGWAAIGGH